MKPIISVENLGKQYLIKHKESRGGYRSLREELFTIPKRLFSKQEHAEMFWALQDVTFDVQQGERIGIIGRNGAGKSTLLKLLSRITEPSTGRITVRGRVASLLEVGTGFHPELSGRENIYLNGAILGMTRNEIRKKFDEIVDFAGVERFLDTPVKRYSSGMYVRLAFAVAAHLEPEILVVDEVLAVGDAEFQKKCLGKMEEVSKGDGRTVLFISHNMEAVKQLCNQVMVLDSGKMLAMGNDTGKLIESYFAPQSGSTVWKGHETSKFLTVTEFGLKSFEGEMLSRPVGIDEDVVCYVECELEEIHSSFNIGVAVYSREGRCLFWTFTTDGPEDSWPELKIGRNVLQFTIPKLFLNEGEYYVELMASLHQIAWLFEPVATPVVFHFTVEGGFSLSPLWLESRPAQLAPFFVWDNAESA